MNGFKPVFVDIDLKTLSSSSEEILNKINKKTLAVFITHAQGFNGFTDKLIKELKKKYHSYRGCFARAMVPNIRIKN